jgi:CspA family cold shock protein
MLIGTVKWFSESKRYGFIGTDDGRDTFIHASEVDRAGLAGLHQGQRVEFEEVKDRRPGPTCATNLRVATQSPRLPA